MKFELGFDINPDQMPAMSDVARTLRRAARTIDQACAGKAIDEEVGSRFKIYSKGQHRIGGFAVVDPEGEARRVIAYLSGLPLTRALWWFLENVNDDTTYKTEVFFYLRERYRKEEQAA